MKNILGSVQCTEGGSDALMHKSKEPHLQRELDWAMSEVCQEKSGGSYPSSHLVSSSFVRTSHERLKCWTLRFMDFGGPQFYFMMGKIWIFWILCKYVLLIVVWCVDAPELCVLALSLWKQYKSVLKDENCAWQTCFVLLHMQHIPPHPPNYAIHMHTHENANYTQ